MSHSKYNKRGKSFYATHCNPDAKRFLRVCALCGAEGYDPSIEDEGFIYPSPSKTDYVHRAIFDSLTKNYKPLHLDELGRCEICKRTMSD